MGVLDVCMVIEDGAIVKGFLDLSGHSSSGEGSYGGRGVRCLCGGRRWGYNEEFM